jgi:hypothetical protein
MGLENKKPLGEGILWGEIASLKEVKEQKIKLLTGIQEERTIVSTVLKIEGEDRNLCIFSVI